MMKFCTKVALIAITALAVNPVNSLFAVDCDEYQQYLYQDILETCSQKNSEFAETCASAHPNNYGSTNLLIKPNGLDYAGNPVSIVYCQILSCTPNPVPIGVVTGVSGNYGFNIVTSCVPDIHIIDTTPPVKLVTDNTNPKTQCGSVIQVSNQVVGETIPLTGLPFYLSHFSSWQTGRTGDYTLSIPINSSTVKKIGDRLQSNH